MKRYFNWPALLTTGIQAAQKRSFQWGVFDCALAACSLIQVMTGIDPGQHYRRKYSSEAEAFALIGRDLGAFAAPIAANFEMPEIPPRQARRGDLVLADNGNPGNPSHALGIVDLSGRYALFAGSRGLLRLRMRRWKRAWRVG